MMKFKIPNRLFTTTIFMFFTLAVIVVLVISLINEKSRIQASLVLAQHSREQILKTESVTEALLLTEIRFKEYCTTFDEAVFEKYKIQVDALSRNIHLLLQSISNDSTREGERIDRLFDEKTREADVYMKLRLLTDSLIFSSASLEENQSELVKYAGSRTKKTIDTISITKVSESHKKGLLGKLKNAIVGEKIQQSENTKLLIHSPGESNSPNEDPSQKQLHVRNEKTDPTNMRKLIRNAFELKESELKLIELNNRLIAEISKLVTEVKNDIKETELSRNNSFLNSVKDSASFLQNALIILILLACILATYILTLSYKNEKFQKNIIDLNDKVMEDSVEKDKFFSIISHDLMNPFNALLGFSEMLNESARNGDKEDVIEYSSVINQSARRIFNLLQNLLVWSRMKNGKMNYSPKPVRIDELISDSMMILSPIAQNKEINLSWEVNSDITATIDPNMINSVLQNLVTNAIKFTERGGSVTVKAFAESDQLKFIISDSGVGMSEEQIMKLFKLNKTSSARGTDDEVGTGLGLIICKEFIELHHGKIWVESTPGQGSDFCFSVALS
ncbi:MAG: HAMP domain-containing histidine kinase [Prolixibacteraceae bacterium]|nr:HAMP domain-containing histidine kinase [Prolixibacteraceae bacterium]